MHEEESLRRYCADPAARHDEKLRLSTLAEHFRGRENGNTSAYRDGLAYSCAAFSNLVQVKRSCGAIHFIMHGASGPKPARLARCRGNRNSTPLYESDE